MMRLGEILRKARGDQSRVQFARKLKLSYTFVRAMEHGLRFPSDKVLREIAERLELDPDELILAAYADRSPMLARVLEKRGIALPGSLSHHPPAETGQRNGTEAPKVSGERTDPPSVQVAHRF